MTVLDPTAGGGSIPFETVRTGLTSVANDLNPVAALVMKATIEWPSAFAPNIAKRFEELATKWRRQIDERLAAFFPQREVDQLDATYLWARTVTCPYCDGVVPLSPNWQLASDGTGVRLLPDCADGPGKLGRVSRFEIVGSAKEQFPGTVARGDGHCPFADCGRVIDGDEIKAQAQAGRMGEQLFAVVYRRRVDRTRTKSGQSGAGSCRSGKWVRGYRAPRPEDDNSADIRAKLDEKLPEWEAVARYGAEAKQLEARVGGQPLANRFMLVGSVVVQDDVQGEVGRERTVETPQELQEFLMSMTPVALADDLAGQHVQRGFRSCPANENDHWPIVPWRL